MGEKIEKDRKRFIDIIKGKIKQDLKKYFKPGKIILPKSKGQSVGIPIHKIDLPTFRYGKNHGGIGQGEGKPGDDLGSIDQEPRGEDEKQAGKEHGKEIIVEFTQEEILDLLKAELPNIQPKGEKMIISEEKKYTDIRKVGPLSLLHRKRTFKEALKRQMASGQYFLEKLRIIPIKDDERYKAQQNIEKPQNNAVLIYMRDVSGSVSFEEREIISYICFCSELWLRSQYDALETAYIVHDTEAKQVETQKEFLEIDFGGGTYISSGHKELVKLIYERFPPELWNIYVMYFSDGMNWEEDDKLIIKLLKEEILPIVNQYAYGEVSIYRSWWGGRAKDSGKFSTPGNFGYCLASEFSAIEPKVVWASLSKIEDAFDAFAKFYGHGN